MFQLMYIHHANISSLRMLGSQFLSGMMPSVLALSGVCSDIYSRQEDEGADNFTSVIGLMQALISVFIDDGDKLRCINAGSTRITFLLRQPLYYACVSSWNEPESVVSHRVSLQCLRGQLIFVKKDTFPSRIFASPDLERCLSRTAPENVPTAE